MSGNVVNRNITSWQTTGGGGYSVTYRDTFILLPLGRELVGFVPSAVTGRGDDWIELHRVDVNPPLDGGIRLHGFSTGAGVGFLQFLRITS